MRLRAPVHRVWGSHLPSGSSTPREQQQCCGCGGNRTANYRVCIKWKEEKTTLTKQALESGQKSDATGHPVAPKAQRAGPPAEQKDLGEGWNHVVRGGVPSRPPPLHTKSKYLSSAGHGGAQEA